MSSQSEISKDRRIVGGCEAAFSYGNKMIISTRGRLLFEYTPNDNRKWKKLNVDDEINYSNIACSNNDMISIAVDYKKQILYVTVCSYKTCTVSDLFLMDLKDMELIKWTHYPQNIMPQSLSINSYIINNKLHVFEGARESINLYIWNENDKIFDTKQYDESLYEKYVNPYSLIPNYIPPRRYDKKSKCEYIAYKSSTDYIIYAGPNDKYIIFFEGHKNTKIFDTENKILYTSLLKTPETTASSTWANVVLHNRNLSLLTFGYIRQYIYMFNDHSDIIKLIDSMYDIQEVHLFLVPYYISDKFNSLKVPQIHWIFSLNDVMTFKK